ncbi:NADH oxidase [Niabella ginsenosidivorans]|uniref:NADH oxidase n=1 Tax=Niabella ginsenosidivorans TaxID=1176587 RepID=A0A1A9HZW7_9BACT|nr:rhodanese-like domain-containing protein [Niabella ginsenosidivorans]ANH80369.1 NADH oxidase [Niabella ginsenosidivorans]
MNTITVEELKKKIDSGEPVHLIDVREPAEYEEYNIGARLIPLGKIQNMEIDELEPLKEEELFIHCRSGKRSAMACQLLESMGFKNTVNVEGGVLAWQEAFDH